MRGSSRSLLLVLLVGCSGSSQPTPPAATPPAGSGSAGSAVAAGSGASAGAVAAAAGSSAAGSSAATAPATGSAGPPTAPAADATPPTALTDAQNQQDAETAPLARSIVDAYPNWNGFFSNLVASWSPDGTRIVFGSVRDGSPEIYAADPAKPADPPAAITRGPERALWAGYTPDGKSLLFLRDTKGDENHHIWRVNPDGTGATDLTPGEPWHRGEPIVPRGRPDVMLYSASRVSDPSTVLYEHPFTGPERSVYINPRPGGLADVSTDGKHALFLDVHSAADVALLDIELSTSTARQIYPAEPVMTPTHPNPPRPQAGIHSAVYSPDGARIYFSTDEGAESSVVLAFDARTAKQVARYVNAAPRGAPIALVASPAGDRIAAGIDAGNHGELRLLDAKTLAVTRTVKVPLGDVQVGTFRPDGKQLSILISQPDHPADVYAVDTATGDLHPLRDDQRAGLDTLPKLTAAIATVPAFDGLQIPVNVYLPAADPKAASDKAAVQRRPTIVIFHGGPASSYAVRWSPYARFFVSLGYAVLEPNVRGSTGFGRAYEMADNREKRADWLKDLATVNAWTKAQPWCDPERVVVWGQSYGGYTTLMALTRQPTLWRAGVDLYGVADLKKFLQTTDAQIRSAFVTEFGDLDKDGDLLDKFSPMRDADKIVRPLFVYAGQNDPRVPRTESDAVVRALRGRNVPVEYMVAANEGHTVDRRDTKIELLTRTARFLAAALK
ncbi:MAG TPA: prolyl oligopeptidase family serine peptidase [Kofleriaceae bacterium]|jgi:dipeptidyl aminopeptidase/acylaminoacyl peptidase|nr:prolyl oligopeptidase family serine peptidase [Kofleriaceae bacterium]